MFYWSCDQLSCRCDLSHIAFNAPQMHSHLNSIPSCSLLWHIYTCAVTRACVYLYLKSLTITICGCMCVVHGVISYAIVIMYECYQRILLLISYSTVVLFIGIKKVGDFGPKLSSQNQLDIYFLRVWEYWLGIAKPKNVFRSTLNPSTK